MVNAVKLRIRDNSIRLRLTRGEVERLAQDGAVSASIAFSDSVRLEYAVEAVPGARAPGAEYTGRRVRVQLPASDVREWAASDRVGITGEQPLGDGARLAILVEKDFACLTPREGEDESDMFPHPLKDAESC